ncbi:hypothetical protein VTK73DRAFT_6662 [Phialemonium thermophilum]|uniref:Uncharacterized protein n=1 Tax=Phialemonium thermophilum TaxID=223376 RepID=A0ABR3WIY1_9PEZI
MATTQPLPDESSAPQKLFHIFGNGISFSISPTIHNAGFQYDGLPFKYDIRESPSIDDVAYLIKSDTFGGASVTMPHKLQVHKYCDRLTDTAKAIGAVNTLIVSCEDDKRIITGDNTDWSGLERIVTEYKTRTKHTLQAGLVIGAGGASRAALYALYHAGVQHIYLVNRTIATAEEIRESFKDRFVITVLPSLDNLPVNPDVIIGTIPADKTNRDQFSDIFGTSGGLCIDMSYKPRQTPLLTAAQTHPGWETVTGIQVLLSQAFDQYRLWTRKEPPTKVMEEAVQRHEAAKAAQSNPEVAA